MSPQQLPPPVRAGVRLRSLTNKIAFLFAGVVLVAFGVVYFYIVPQLQSNLEQQMLDDLSVEASNSDAGIEQVMDTDRPQPEVNAIVQRTAGETDARITLLGIQRSAGSPGSYYQITDSSSGSRAATSGTRQEAPARGGRREGDPDRRSGVDPAGAGQPVLFMQPDVSLEVADTAVEQERVETGLGRSGGELVAQAAAPLRGSREIPPEWVAVYSRPVDDVTEAVGLIQRQVLVAGALAVLVALTGGWLVARAVTRRVRRLESAAREVTAGRSAERVPIDSEDELGQLTRAFNEMQEQLERTERARRDFIANASHELRTPIFSLGGFAELLQDEDYDAETKDRFLGAMREQIERLEKLSADLLDLSRLDAGALGFHPREVDLSEVAQTVASEFAPIASRHGSEIGMDLPKDRLAAWCDPERVAQILRILLDNALRHTPSGTQVKVGAGHRNGAAELAVTDTGPGIEPAFAERVFERFYTSDAARGSGLGLAIARELAERMDGRISLRSAPGDTAFTLALPVGPNGGSVADDLSAAGSVADGERAGRGVLAGRG